jgi:hypothetical protein
LLCSGDAGLPARVLAGVPPLMFAGVLATAGVPPLVRAARACAGCELVNVISVAITAATTHITTAAAAVVAPGLPRIVSRPTSLAARGNHAGCSNFARRVARRRYVSTSRGRPAQSQSTCSAIRGEAWLAGTDRTEPPGAARRACCGPCRPGTPRCADRPGRASGWSAAHPSRPEEPAQLGSSGVAAKSSMINYFRNHVHRRGLKFGQNVKTRP